MPTLDDLAKALDEPARPLFIGRKPCLPASRLFAGWSDGRDAHHALARIPWQGVSHATAGERRKEPPSHLRAQWPEGEGPYLRGRDEQPAARLQQDGSIEKLGSKTYIITERGRAFLRRVLRAAPVDAPRIGRMPPWARRLIYAASQRNGPEEPRFTETDLTTLWQRCGGSCAITRLEFTDEKVGTGRAKRAFAPSVDKIDSEGAYTVENCRLVMVAVNFALNTW